MRIGRRATAILLIVGLASITVFAANVGLPYLLGVRALLPLPYPLQSVADPIAVACLLVGGLSGGVALVGWAMERLTEPSWLAGSREIVPLTGGDGVLYNHPVIAPHLPLTVQIAVVEHLTALSRRPDVARILVGSDGDGEEAASDRVFLLTDASAAMVRAWAGRLLADGATRLRPRDAARLRHLADAAAASAWVIWWNRPGGG